MKNRWIIVFTVILLLIFQTSTFQQQHNSQNTNTNLTKNPALKLSSSVSTLELNDSNIMSYASSGTGTVANPYIISGLVISNNGGSNGLIVTNLNSYYVTIKNVNISSTSDGIYVTNSSHITFDMIHSFNNTDGLYFDQNSQFITITASQVYNNSQFGILVYNSGNITVRDTNSYSNTQIGVYMVNSGDNVVTNGNYSFNGNSGAVITGSGTNNSIDNNYLSYNSYAGAYLYQTSNASIYNNICGNQYSGVVVSFSSGSVVSNNTIKGNLNGVEMNNATNDIVTGNKIDNNTNGFNFYSLAFNNLITYNNITNSVNNNMLITNSTSNKIMYNSLSSSQQEQIKLVSQSNNTVIQGNYFTNSFTAIFSNYSSHLMVSSNSFYNVSSIINGRNESDITVFNNSYNQYNLNYGGAAINLTSVTGFKINNNQITTAYQGSIIQYSSSGLFEYNTFSNTASWGYDIISSSNINITRNSDFNGHGAEYHVDSSTNVTINYNYVNPYFGEIFDYFYLSTAVIERNVFLNGNVFIYFYYPKSIILRDNAFYLNPSSSYQTEIAVNQVSDVQFVNNYWNLYNGTDANNDGIGDTPYSMVDYYSGYVYDNAPLMTTPAIEINGTTNLFSPLNTVTFNISSYFNSTYNLEVNSTVKSTGTNLQGQHQQISYTLENTKALVFNVTLIVTDQYNEVKSFTTMVTIDPRVPTITGPDNFTFNGTNDLVEWNITDNYLQSVEMTFNSVSTTKNTTISGIYIYQLPFTLANGSYLLSVVATDQDGYSSYFTTNVTVALPTNLNIVVNNTQFVNVTVTTTVTVPTTTTVTASGNTISSTTPSSSSSNKSKSTPGFTIAFVLIGLVIIGFASKKRLQRK